MMTPLTRLKPSLIPVDERVAGTVLLKRDDLLPVAGSIKACGGFFEVIEHAFQIVRQAGLDARNGDYAALAGAAARDILKHRRVIVASTGNLGLSVGLIGRALGMAVDVHMSRDAKAWKKQRLRDAGANVVEHASDYLDAVHAAAREAMADPASHFVDDEHSRLLFLGYNAAAPQLKQQLESMALAIGPDRPLFVYLPCGIGGAPGGIAFGLKALFGLNVHCFFAEPVNAPCMLAQMSFAGPEPRSIYDLGLTGMTEADGLAVSQASLLVANMMRTRLAGIFTQTDKAMLDTVARLHREAGIALEPSATAGLAGPALLHEHAAGQAYIHANGLGPKMAEAVHVVWSTGGSLVPPEVFQSWLDLS